jgi:hypothetical protein
VRVPNTNDVRVELYRSFVEECRAPEPAEMATALGMPLEQVRASLRELAGQDVIAFRPGTEDVWLAHPFCATDAPFKVNAGTRRWDAICVWDALGILALTEADGSVETSCPDCKEPLLLSVAEGRVERPDGSVVHFGVPARRWYEDVGFT